MTTICGYEVHPAAEAFPIFDDGLDRITKDIEDRGQQVPALLFDGRLLDGRHRMLACERLGIAPLKPIPYDGNPWQYVWTHNGARWDGTQAIKAQAKLYLEEHEQLDLAVARAAAVTAAGNAKRAEKARAQPRTPDGRRLAQVADQSDLPPARPNVTRQARAAEAGVSQGVMGRAETLRAKRPDLAEGVRKGELKETEALRQMKREQVAQKVAALPADKYRVIYADPPWQYNDSRGGLEGYEATAAEDHYPTMSVSELCALDIRSLAAPDSVLLCWATFPLLPDALDVVKAWGFKYKTAFVWSKQRANMAHYHNASAELLLVCVRGSCTPDAKKREDQVQTVKRTGRHSEKPEDFRAMIDRLWTEGKRIELFRRGEAPEGWEVWGNESA